MKINGALLILFVAICFLNTFLVSSHDPSAVHEHHNDDHGHQHDHDDHDHHDEIHHHHHEHDHHHDHDHHDHQDHGIHHHHHEHDHHDHEHDHGHTATKKKNPVHGAPGHKCNHDISRFLSEEEKHNTTAIFLTFVSGMAAMLGGVIVLFIGEPSPTILGHLLSFAAGVMLYISYCDLLGHAQAHLGDDGFFLGNMWMFAGMGFFFIVVTLIPEPELTDIVEAEKVDTSKLTVDELKAELISLGTKVAGDRSTMIKQLETARSEKKTASNAERKRLMRTGLVAAIGISLHNFPEGLVVYNATITGICEEAAPSVFNLAETFSYASKCMGRGLAVSMAIALHNIPEGMAVAMPIYASTRSKWQAMKWCLVSSICEPLAAILFGLTFNNYLTTHIIQVLNAVVAGIMVMLCLVELIPSALEHLSPKAAAFSNVVGQVVMFLSLHFLIQAGAH